MQCFDFHFDQASVRKCRTGTELETQKDRIIRTATLIVDASYRYKNNMTCGA